MSILRSEDMDFYHFTCLKDNVNLVIDKLGDLGNMDFVDLNKGEQPFNLPFGHTVKRCEETLKNLSILSSECSKWGINLSAPKGIDEMKQVVKILQDEMQKTETSFFDTIEDEVKKFNEWSKETFENYNKSKSWLASLLMMREVYKMSLNKYKDSAKIEEEIIRKADPEKDTLKEPLLGGDDAPNLHSISTSTVTGVIDKVDVLRLTRMIFRATRGKAM